MARMDEKAVGDVRKRISEVMNKILNLPLDGHHNM